MIGFCFGIKIILDRIHRIFWIVGPSAQEYLAAGEKNPINPVNPVNISNVEIESIPYF